MFLFELFRIADNCDDVTHRSSSHVGMSNVEESLTYSAMHTDDNCQAKRRQRCGRMFINLRTCNLVEVTRSANEEKNFFDSQVMLGKGNRGVGFDELRPVRQKKEKKKRSSRLFHDETNEHVDRSFHSRNDQKKRRSGQ